MADVFVARDTTLDRRVAIKRLKAELAHARGARAFRCGGVRARGLLPSECGCGVRLRQRRGSRDGGPFIVMELVDGPTLAQHLRDHEGTLSAGEATADCRAGTGCARCRPREGHCAPRREAGQRPARRWSTREARRLRHRQGRARRRPRSHLHGQVVGTPKYLAPERVVGHDATPQSDLYSVAVMCFEMVTGAPPYLGDSTEAMLEAQRTRAGAISARVAAGRSGRVGRGGGARVGQGSRPAVRERGRDARSARDGLDRRSRSHCRDRWGHGDHADGRARGPAVSTATSNPCANDETGARAAVGAGSWCRSCWRSSGSATFALTNMGGDDGGPGPLPGAGHRRHRPGDESAGDRGPDSGADRAADLVDRARQGSEEDAAGQGQEAEEGGE